MVRRRGEMERQCVVALVAGVGIGAVLEQEPDSLRMIYCDVKAGCARVTLMSEARLAREQFAQGGNVT